MRDDDPGEGTYSGLKTTLKLGAEGIDIPVRIGSDNERAGAQGGRNTRLASSARTPPVRLR